MGNLKGVVITKGSTGASNAAPNTSVSFLIGNFGTVADKLAANTVYKITSVKQAEEQLGITPARDITADVVCHRHIVDFYSMCGEGVELYVISTNAATPAEALEDVDALYAKKAIIAAKGAIRNVGLAWNVAASANAESLTDGMPSIIRNAIPKAQLFADWCSSTERQVHVFIECRGISSTESTVLNLRDIQVNNVKLNAPQVTLIAGQDWDYAEARRTNNNAPANTKVHLYAAVGKVLGTAAAAEMNQSIAEADTFNLSDAKRGYFITGGLSNHKKIDDVEAVLQGLDDKGYIFPISYHSNVISGLRWNGDHNCIEVVIDADGNINEHTIYYSRTLNEVCRLLRDTLLVSLKKRVSADAATGYMTTGAIKVMEADADNKVFENYANKGFISNGKTFINKQSDLITPPKTLLVNFEVQPTLIIDNIGGVVKLKKSITL